MEVLSQYITLFLKCFCLLWMFSLLKLFIIFMNIFLYHYFYYFTHIGLMHNELILSMVIFILEKFQDFQPSYVSNSYVSTVNIVIIVVFNCHKLLTSFRKFDRVNHIFTTNYLASRIIIWTREKLYPLKYLKNISGLCCLII